MHSIMMMELILYCIEMMKWMECSVECAVDRFGGEGKTWGGASAKYV